MSVHLFSISNFQSHSLSCIPQNKTSSAVQLKHLPTGMVIKSQATRSRSQNRKIARTLLAERLEFIEKGSESRVAIKGEVKRKKKASKDKKARRKYRALDEANGKSNADDGEETGDGVAEVTGNGFAGGKAERAEMP